MKSPENFRYYWEIPEGRTLAKPAKHPNQSQQNFLHPLIKYQLNPKHPLYVLAGNLDWARLESELLPFYSNKGRPAKPISLMAGLMLLKQLDNLGDKTVMAKWLENPYYQFFCGIDVFQWLVPVDPSDSVYFCNRLGEEGVIEKKLDSIKNIRFLWETYNGFVARGRLGLWRSHCHQML